jgi:hypothetical protein
VNGWWRIAPPYDLELNMRRLIALCTIVLALLITAVALAVNPTKGGTYTGIKPGVIEKKLSLKVASNGKTAIANLYCSGKHVSTMKGVVIAKGQFTGLKGKASFPIWKLSGKFTSKTAAKATAKLTAICDGGRAIINLTLAP